MDRRVLCVRPMCGAMAQAALHYDYADRKVWLEALSEHLAAGAWSICSTHADGLRVPSGWELVDQRSRPEATAIGAGGRGPIGSDRAPGAAPAGRNKEGERLSFSPPLAV